MIPGDLIDGSYTDALGTRRVVPATTRDLFAAILGAEVPPEIAPPAVVVRMGDEIVIDTTLPAASWTGTLHWTVNSDDATVDGELPIRSAPVIHVRHDGETVIDTRRVTVPVRPGRGTHRLLLDAGEFGSAESDVVVVPPRAHGLAADARVWGIAVQLYTLRSGRNWGIGDFTDLRAFCELAGREGARYVGINPLHATHRFDAESASPYSPASRHFLNWLAIDVEAVPEAREPAVAMWIAENAGELGTLRVTPFVNYAGVARVKNAALQRCFDARSPERDAAFRRFVDESSIELRRFAIYETIVARHGRSIEAWPPALQSPEGEGVEAFARREARDIEFSLYLQWCAAEQLHDVAQAAAQAGVELYRDLAVGVEANAADVWIDGGFVRGASVGAPPDILNRRGQDWGLPPPSPIAMQRSGYAAFASMLADNMRDAGALRIDHAMSLMRLFWIPPGGDPPDGTYIAYPFDDLLGIVARESVRACCVVIGEDLGTVPEGFRERMNAANILSYKILFFERNADGTFFPPEWYPPQSLATPTTHDLAPFSAWLSASDVTLREQLGVIGPERASEEFIARARDREQLLDALRAHGDLAADRDDEMSVIIAAHAYLAASPARVVMANIDDVIGETAPVNIPGTSSEYPNWRRKLSLDIESIGADERFRRLCEHLRAIRPRKEEDRA